MRKSSTIVIALLVSGATMASACGDRGGPKDEPRAQAAQDTPLEQPAVATIALTGCLEAAPGKNQFVLRNVRFEPRAGDPHATTTTPGGQGITEGAWVRLDGSGQDLSRHLGERVLIKGTIEDDGRNTIGTAGTAGLQTPAGDTSQAASHDHYSEKYKQEAGRIARESMADGTAAEVKVREVSGTGDRCVPPSTREK
jgi:hypothetical protein